MLGKRVTHFEYLSWGFRSVSGVTIVGKVFKIWWKVDVL